MKKNIYTGIFCTILGLCINTPANASIVSRNFLDEALTDYATNTALDLKANQSDFTELNTQISDSVDVLRLLFEQSSSSYEFVNNIDPEKFPNTISGAFSLLYGYLDRFASSTLYGWTDSFGTYYRGFADLNNGWTDSEKKTYLGVKGLNDKIGTLPEGITVQNMFQGWTHNDRYFPGLSTLSDYPTIVEDAYNIRFPFLFTQGSQSTTIDGVDYTGPVYPLWKLSEEVAKIDSIETKIGTLPEGITVQGMLDGWTDPSGYNFPGLYELASDTFKFKNTFPNVSIGMLLSVGLEKYTNNIYTGPIYPLWKLSEGIDKIGTLPSGSLLNQTRFTDVLYNMIQGTESPVYPNSMAELVKQIYGEFSSSVIQPGLVHILITGFPNNGILPVDSDEIGILPAISLAENASSVANTANETAQANATKIGTVPDGKNLAGMISETDAKIGTLPSGEFPIFPGFDRLFPGLNQPLTYPTSLAELITAIYGNSETGARGLLAAIITGFPYFDKDGDGSPDKPIGLIPNYQSAIRANDLADANTAKIGTVPDGKNLAGMISETDAKIGTLPTEYATVGAALTAIKGIAEDAKAAALAAIPDPKTEGSNGKYVLTVDIVGDNATYRWEPIDRGDTTPTTE